MSSRHQPKEKRFRPKSVPYKRGKFQASQYTRQTVDRVNKQPNEQQSASIPLEMNLTVVESTNQDRTMTEVDIAAVGDEILLHHSV